MTQDRWAALAQRFALGAPQAAPAYGRELGNVLLAWCAGRGTSGEGPYFDAASAAALAGGYAAETGDQPRVDRDCFGTAAAVQTNFLHAMAAQAVQDPDPGHRRFAGRQLASLLDGGLDGLRRDIELACAALGG